MKKLLVKLWLVAVLTAGFAFVAIELISDHVRSDEELDDEVNVFAPGYLIAAERFAATPAEKQSEVLESLEEVFGYPVRVAEEGGLPDDVPLQLLDGLPIAYAGEDKYATPIPGATNYLVFGPLPPLPARHVPVRILILAVVAVGFGLMFWLLLRSLGREHIALENAAEKIAEGDFKTRVEDNGREPSSLVAAFNRMAGQTEGLIESQQALLRGVSHELRTPISRLRIGVHLLARTDETEARTARVKDLDADLADIDELIESLLTNARLDAFTSPMKVAIRVEDTAKAVVEKERDGSALTIDVDCGKVCVFADPKLFKWVIRNLLRNAIVHAKTRVHVTAKNEGGWGALVVEDDGPGIPPEEREAVTLPFHRLEDSSHSGYGVGLSLVRDIVEKHGGKLCIEDAEPGGCRIETRWPTS